MRFGWSRAGLGRGGHVPRSARSPTARVVAWWVRSRCPLSVSGSVVSGSQIGGGARKNPRQLGCCTRVARRCWWLCPARASAASTRFPITTSNPGACITVDGSLRTGHRSNSGIVGVVEFPAPPHTVRRWRCECRRRRSAAGRHPDLPDGAFRGRILHARPARAGARRAGLGRAAARHPGHAVGDWSSRYRTVADSDDGDRALASEQRDRRWDDIDGLRFGRSSWATAHLKDGRELRLPAVTFATLPLLTEASGGRVPNPYA